MRVFAVSDLHVDYAANASWVTALSSHDYVDDILILAGDVSDDLRLLEATIAALARKFAKLFFVPGNHDLWVARRDPSLTSLGKFEAVRRAVHDCGASTQPYRGAGFWIVPLLSWYDYSFGEPSDDLRAVWTDFVACRWPEGMTVPAVATHFLSRNPANIGANTGETVLTFSHFMPRADLLPMRAHHRGIDLHPVLGSTRLDKQLRLIGSSTHVYGHSHVPRTVLIDGVTYVNNALGYPSEVSTRPSGLRCVLED